MKYKNGIAERDSKWYIKYQSNQRNSNGRKISIMKVCPVDIKTRSQAKRYREQQMQLVYQGKIGIGKDALFIDILNHMKEETVDKGLSSYNKEKISGTSISTEKDSINMIKKIFGSYKLSDLSVLEIENTMNKAIDINNWGSTHSRAYFRVLQNAMNFAIRQPEYDLHINHADNVNLVYDKSKKKIVPFESQDINNIIDYYINLRDTPTKTRGETTHHKYHYQRNLVVIILGAFHGLRRSEIVGLQWKDLHFDFGIMEINGVIDIKSFKQIEEKSMSREKMNELNWITNKGLVPVNQTDYKVPDTQLKLIRIMYKDYAKTFASLVDDHPLHPDWIDELKYLKELQSDLMDQKNLVQNGDDFVFTPVRTGNQTSFKSGGYNCDLEYLKRPMQPQSANQIFDKLLDEEIIKKDQTVHTLRHYYGSQLVALLNRPLQTDSSGNVIPNPSLPQLARLMRHGDAGETLMRTYAHAFQQSFQENKVEWMSSVGKVEQLRIV